jgi:hypothetical protein
VNFKNEDDESDGDLLDALPDCVLKRALQTAIQREARDGGTILNDHLRHLVNDDEEALHMVMHSGAHHAIDSMQEAGVSPLMPLCYAMSWAFAEGMALGVGAQARYEQETRDELASLPVRNH